MKRAMFAMLVVAFCMPALAGGTLVLTDAGYQTMTAEPGQPAVLSPVTPVDRVVDLRTGAPAPNPPPGGDPTPTPDDPTSLTVKVTGWAKEVNDPNGAAVLAQSYKLIGQQIASGAIPSDAASVDKSLSQFLDQALGMVAGSKEKWSGPGKFRSKVADELASRVIAKGGTLTPTEYKAFFDEVSDGLTASNAGYALPFWLQQIITALLPILLQLITQLFGGAG